MQMIAEVGAENNSTTVLMIPSDFVSLAHSLNEFLASKPSAPPERGERRARPAAPIPLGVKRREARDGELSRLGIAIHDIPMTVA